MLCLLIYMNFMGILFYILHLFLLPFEQKYIPPYNRIFLYRLNMVFFIFPFPICLFYIRRYFDTIVSKIPVSPFYYNGSHVIVHLGQNISFALPKLNILQVVFFLVWIAVMITKYSRFVVKNRKLRDFNSFLSLFQKEEFAKSSIDVNKLVNVALKELNIKKKPRIFLQESLIVPHVSGVFRITLCLPSHWDVTEQVYYMAIKHELAHVRNKDLLFQRISLIARIISWFNPVLYLLCSKIELCEELIADACACDGASQTDRNAYQTAILELSSISSSLAYMPIKGFGFKPIRKDFTKERILTMKNQSLYSHRSIKMIITVLASIVISSMSIIPALSYNLPSALESENITIEPLDMFDFNVLPVDTSPISAPVSIQSSKGELFSFLENLDFSTTNFICIDKNGVISDGIIEPSLTLCDHNYLAMQAAYHDRSSNKNCYVTYYNAKKCSKCSHIIILERQTVMEFDKCPH